MCDRIYIPVIQEIKQHECFKKMRKTKKEDDLSTVVSQIFMVHLISWILWGVYALI